MPLNLPTDCDGYGKKFMVPNALSCPKGGIVLSQHKKFAKEWDVLSSWAINPSCISYKTKINSMSVQGERNGARVWVAREKNVGGVARFTYL